MRLSINLSAHIMCPDAKGDQLSGLLTEIVAVPHPKYPQLSSGYPRVSCQFQQHLQSAIVEFCLMKGISGVNVVVASQE